MTLGQAGLVVALVWLWQWMADHGQVNAFVTGKPSLILHELSTWWNSGALLTDLRATLVNLAVGYLLGMIAGALIGSLLGLYRLFRDVCEPFILFLNGMPRLLLYPLLIVVLGYGVTSKLLMVVLAVVVIIAVTIASGFREIDQDLVDNIRLQGAGGLDLARQVYLPSLTLWILSTTRSSIGYAFSAALVSEFVGATQGLGYRVVLGQANLDMNVVWAAIAVIVAVALIIHVVLGAIERRATRWLIQ
jgi:NitT/TauT family transport system permease protein